MNESEFEFDDSPYAYLMLLTVMDDRDWAEKGEKHLIVISDMGEERTLEAAMEYARQDTDAVGETTIFRSLEKLTAWTVIVSRKTE